MRAAWKIGKRGIAIGRASATVVVGVTAAFIGKEMILILTVKSMIELEASPPNEVSGFRGFYKL